jgi:hypothetical protein
MVGVVGVVVVVVVLVSITMMAAMHMTAKAGWGTQEFKRIASEECSGLVLPHRVIQHVVDQHIPILHIRSNTSTCLHSSV